MNQESENAAIASRMESLLEGVKRDLADGVTVIELPRGRELHSIKKHLDEYLKKPERRNGVATLRTLDSLIDHANRFKSLNSALFAHPDPKNPLLLSVLNYHPKDLGADPTAADWRDHRGSYAFELSEQWQAWQKAAVDEDGDAKWHSMAEFAQFLESRLEDVADPGSSLPAVQQLADHLELTFASPNQLIKLSRGLTVNANRKVTNAQNLTSGEVTLNYEETHETSNGSQKVTVPGAFLINIPVFRGDAFYQIACRLRYRPSGTSVMWSFQLYRDDRVFDHAFTEAVTRAQKETGLPLFYGSPE